MREMVGIYFSGTGNTKYCIEQFVKEYSENAKTFSIEEKGVIEEIEKDDMIIFAYPVQYSNIPKILHDFIIKNKDVWKGKNIFVIATMAMFSGDGAGVLSRLLKKYGANIVGGLHLKMPDSICDEKVLKHSVEYNHEIIVNSKAKIKQAVMSMKNGNPTQDGMKFYQRLIGLFGQRLYFTHKVRKYSTKLKINEDKCIGCKKCIAICPMNNISLKNKKVVQNGKCTMCYRCISQCPKQAITLLGNRVIEQSYIDKYL